MAIISIPSTIGGVTIPGTASSGPLGALFGSQYKLSALQYPRDLGSMTKGHFVQFSLYQRKGQSLNSFGTIGAITNIANQGLNETTATAALDAATTDVKQISQNVIGKLGSPNSSALTISPEYLSKPDIISLYMPDTVNITNQSSYSGTSVMSAVGEALGLASQLASKSPIGGGILGGLASIPGIALSALNSNPAKLLLATQGLALNPKNQLLFEGIDFRSYQLAFTFTPYSAEEAETVRQIIKTFKKHAAPTIITETAGMFFRPPSTVGVQFMFNGKENPNIAKVTESVIESVDVNNAPNGWAAHDNGAPVQTTLTLQMKEIQLVDSVMIDKQGF
jgi:hypothetical protein